MTFDDFKAEFIGFLETSTVNLGRKTTKTRQNFLNEAASRIEVLREFYSEPKLTKKTKNKKAPKNPMKGSVIRIKPTSSNKGLNVGKGVHAMTQSESGRADEQLNRSPFTGKTGE